MASRRRSSSSRPKAVREIAAAWRDDALVPQRLLLDTHTWLWWQADSPRLGKQARRVITGAADVFLSAASGWEIAIKIGLGKLVLPPGADIAAALRRRDMRPLAVDFRHTAALLGVPLHHRDPFDRMLVAQAMVEGLAIVTADAAFSEYDVRIVDASS